MSGIEDPCCNFTHLDLTHTMCLLHNSNHIVARIDLIEVANGQLRDLLAK